MDEVYILVQPSAVTIYIRLLSALHPLPPCLRSTNHCSNSPSGRPFLSRRFHLGIANAYLGMKASKGEPARTAAAPVWPRPRRPSRHDAIMC